jgi:hypothetical protein
MVTHHAFLHTEVASALTLPKPPIKKRIIPLNGERSGLNENNGSTSTGTITSKPQATKRGTSADGDLSLLTLPKGKRRKVAAALSLTDTSEVVDEEDGIEITAYKPAVTEVLDDDDEVVIVNRSTESLKAKKASKRVDPNRKVHPFFAPQTETSSSTTQEPTADEPTANQGLGVANAAGNIGQAGGTGKALKLRSDLPNHSFFSAASKSISVVGQSTTSTWPTKVGWSKDGQHPVEARLPRKDDCHVYVGDLQRDTLQPLFLTRRQRQAEPVENAEKDAWWKGQLTRQHHGSQSPSQGKSHTSSLGNYQQLPRPHHPAFQHIASIAADHTKDIHVETWAEKYRPRKGEQVLCNEEDAAYLRDWLEELELGHDVDVQADSDRAAVTRKEITRKVVKAKKRALDPYDGWLVNDSDPITEFGSDDIGTSQEAICSEANNAADDFLLAKSSKHPSFKSRLTNSILLQGPSGCGKTAAVYAVAAELDWEVFEVYPGIGKRSGTNLGILVGDVGKNHMVGKGHMAAGSGGHSSTSLNEGKAKPKNGIQALFSARVKESPSHGSDSESAIAIDNAVPVAAVDLTKDTANDSSNFGYYNNDSGIVETSGRVRQSLILLEEVDILFEEDKGFWQAVVSLIAESKRPVVMTCNGKSKFCF